MPPEDSRDKEGTTKPSLKPCVLAASIIFHHADASGEFLGSFSRQWKMAVGSPHPRQRGSMWTKSFCGVVRSQAGGMSPVVVERATSSFRASRTDEGETWKAVVSGQCVQAERSSSIVPALR